MAQLVARLVRNEKVGGSNPPSSTTGRHPIRMSVFCMPGRCCGGALRRWCSGRCVCFVGPGCSVCPWAAARPRAVRAASFARRVVSKPGLALPPPTGTAVGPCHRPPVPRPGPAAAHEHRSLSLRSLRRPPHWRHLACWCVADRAPSPPTGTAVWPCHRPRAPQPGPPDPPAPFTPAALGVRLCRLAPHPPCMRYKVRPARTKLAKTGHFERAGRVLYRTCNEEGCAGRFLYRKRGRMARAGRILSRPPAPSSGPEPLHRH